MTFASSPEWIDPVGDESAVRQTGAVQAALLTTYDPPDPTLLVDDLLPRWFQMDREASSDEGANRVFLVELESELQRRRGKLAIFSSAAVLGPESRHWIWSHVDRHSIGARGSVVQHAKLWLLHRIAEDGAEHLDIQVSSTNLSRSAVREQVQAGFRCSVPVGSKTSHAALGSWDALGPFLRELGSHAGKPGEAAVSPWLGLLARCRCPEGVTFIASVPGTHLGCDWGVRALGKALRLPARTEVDILVPTVGNWTKHQIESWAKAVGTLPKRVGLAWIGKGHPWAKHWQLPASAAAAMVRAGVSLLALAEKDGDARQRLHRRFEPHDERWPHAKVYWFERGASPRVLVTSANWSGSAWGILVSKNRLRIENFELGVLLYAQKRPFRTLREMTQQPATVDVERDVREGAPWVHAYFDGSRLVVQVIKDEAVPRKIVTIDPDNKQMKLAVQWKVIDGLLQTTRKRVWQNTPAVVVLMLRGSEHWISVQDRRAPEESLEQPMSRPPGIDDDDLKRLRAKILEERYGGRLIDIESSPPGGGSTVKKRTGAVLGDYSVWLLDEARRTLEIVDAWANALRDVESPALREVIERDGRELQRLWRDERDFAGPRAVALVVACHEMHARLRRSE